VASFLAASRPTCRRWPAPTPAPPTTPTAAWPARSPSSSRPASTPCWAIRAATAKAADLLGVPDRGVLRQGAAADVLVAGGDVAADVTVLHRPAAVFQDGRQIR
jgi:cytosine/adenosine deaminase-related metal-dependent hydrolase